MYAATVTVITPTRQGAAHEALRRIVSDRRVEHLHIRAGPGRLIVTVFLSATAQPEADLLAYRLCANALRHLLEVHLDT